MCDPEPASYEEKVVQIFHTKIRGDLVPETLLAAHKRHNA